MDVSAGSATLRGRGRVANEDALKIFLDQATVRRAARGTLFAVANGCGVDGFGRQTAWAAVEGLGVFFELLPESFSASSGLVRALERVRDNVRVLGERVPGCSGSSTTLSVIYVAPSIDRGLLVSIGDNPAWVYHRGKLSSLASASSAPERLGPGLSPQVTHRALRFQAGDVFLLATAGLMDAVSRAEIEDRLSAHIHPADVAADLAELATRSGPEQDVTVLVLRFGEAPERRPPTEV